MSRVSFLSVVAALTAALTCAAAAAAPSQSSPRPMLSKVGTAAAPDQWVPGRVLVEFRAGVTRAEARRSLAARGARSVQRINAFGIEVVDLPRGLSVPRAVAVLKADPRVRVVEPDFYRYVDTPPDDTFASQLWALENTAQNHWISHGGTSFLEQGTADADLDVTEAWGQQIGQSSTVVAVVDTGVDVTHPDLAASLWQNPLEAGGTPNVDDDGNGKIDDVHGWNFAGNNNTLLSPAEPEGYDHGTHVAGTIGAVKDNMTGVAGVCPGCKVMALRFMNDAGQLTLSAELAAIAYAKAEGAHIMNASYGGPGWSVLERNALRTSGLLVVVAAGNSSLDNDVRSFFDIDGDFVADVSSPSYPAAFDLPNVLTVAASNHNDEYAYQTGCVTVGGNPKPACAFTNWGHDSVDVAAPGVDVLSTVPVGSGDIGSDYEVFDGTSMAAPHVAAVAGLVKSEHAEYTPAMLKNAIMRSVDRPGNLGMMPTLLFASRKAGSFTRTNNGRVNAEAALDASTAGLANTDGNIAGAVAMLGRKTGAAAWPADVNDVFKRSLSRGKRYRIRLDGLALRDFDLYVYKPGTQEIWQPRRVVASAIGVTADETVTFKAPSTGTYFIQVTVWLGGSRLSGSYVLTVTRL